MTDISQSQEPIQQEGLIANSPVSEATWQAMGGGINFLLANILPVGSIIPSMLTEGTFQSETGTNWVLCDGRSVSGSRYQTLTGNSTLPDLCGRFLRGKNNSHNFNYADQDGEKSLGTYTGDKFAIHNHALTDPGHAHSLGAMYDNTDEGNYAARSNSPGNVTSINTSTVTTGILLATAGSNETSPRCVTVNYFIRIN